MDDYNVYCYDNNNSTRIYKYVNKTKIVNKPDKNVIFIIQITKNIRKNFLIELFDECFKYNQYCKIKIILLNDNCNYYEVTRDNINNILSDIFFIKITNNISYNKLNNVIINNILDSDKYEIVFIANGENNKNENIDESIIFLKNIIETKEISMKMFLLSEIRDDNILYKYTNLINNDLNISFIDNFNINEIVTNIEYINLFGTNFKLNIINNLYVLEVYDFLYCNCNLLESDEKYDIEKQLDILNESIYNCYEIDDISILEKILYRIKDIENTYKKEIETYHIGLNIVNNIYYIFLKLYNSYINKCDNLVIQNIIDFSDISVSLRNIFINKYKYKFFNLIKKNINLLNNHKIDTYEIKLDHNKYFEESKNIFYSVLTISDWVEELQNNNFMGLLIRTNSLENITKLGYKSNKILNITNTIIPFKSYKDIFINYFNKNKCIDTGYNNPMISGNTIGDGNMIFPLYICKENWKISRLYFKPLLSLIIGQNPLLYTDSHINTIFKIFFKMITKTFNQNNEYTNDKWLYILFAVYMTCKKIIKEDNINLDGIYYNFIKSNIYRTKHYTPSLYTLLGYIIIEGIDVYNINVFTKYIIQEKIRRKIFRYLPKKIQIFNYLKCDNGEIEIDNIKIDSFIKNFDNTKLINDLLSFCKFYKLMKNYRNLEEKLDKTYSLLPKNDLENIQKYIKNNLNTDITFKKLMDETNGYNDKDYLYKCIIQGIEQKNSKIRTKYIKNKLYQNLFTTSYNNLIDNIIKRYSNDKDMKTINCT